ncbi:MAG: PIN domain-containing protein [Rhizobiales bacterium]|nr:PIN domain-containing protein [Hyphomicrobiales bacterium]
MRIECFLDTNVLLYAASTRIEDARKYKIAERLLLTTYFGLSGQVLAEFVSKLKKVLIAVPPISEIVRWLDLLSNYPTAPIDERTVRAGLHMSERYGISYWDGAILASAEHMGAPILYTEDLNHGQTYGSVKVINPFQVN